MIGFDPDGGIGGLWNVVQGSVGGLRQQDTVRLDEFCGEALGVKNVRDVAEIEAGARGGLDSRAEFAR